MNLPCLTVEGDHRGLDYKLILLLDLRLEVSLAYWIYYELISFSFNDQCPLQHLLLIPRLHLQRTLLWQIDVCGILETGFLMAIYLTKLNYHGIVMYLIVKKLTLDLACQLLVL